MFKKKNSVGIFFGSRGVSIVDTAGKGKIKNHSLSLYPKDITKPGGITAPKDNIFNVFIDNEEEIIAFLSKSLRESRIDIENSDIVVCIPNRDLIVRFFEIPQIPMREIDSTIGFEIKKYIPFKTEDIAYDYQTHSQKNVIEVLFAGIKKDDLEKYNSLISQLRLNVSAIEPSQFSLLRMLKIAKIINSKEAFVIVELEKGEGSITIIDSALPCFSRDVRIASGSESLEPDVDTLSFRLVNEVRVSIDYFRRQFMKKGVDKVVILSKQELKELVSNFNKELGVAVEYCNPDNICGLKEEHSLDYTKAMGASLRVSKPSSLTINLAAKGKASTTSLLQQVISQVFEEISDIPKAIIIKTLVSAVAVLSAIFLFGQFQAKPFAQEFSIIFKDAKSTLTGDLKGLDAKKLSALNNKLKQDLGVYKNIFRKDILISEKLIALPELLPEGIWLEDITFNRGSRKLILKGTVYREDEAEASEIPYLFVSNLKNSHLFSNKVSSISVGSLTSAYEKDYRVTKFNVDINIGK